MGGVSIFFFVCVIRFFWGGDSQGTVVVQLVLGMRSLVFREVVSRGKLPTWAGVILFLRVTPFLCGFQSETKRETRRHQNVWPSSDLFLVSVREDRL